MTCMDIQVTFEISGTETKNRSMGSMLIWPRILAMTNELLYKVEV